MLRIDIAEEFRALRGQSLPADGMVVLFGPNSAGKSTVLEAIGELIGLLGRIRSDPGDPDGPFPIGAIWFDLPEACTDGSKDAEIFRALFCGENTTEWAWDWLGPGIAALLKEADLDEARTYLASRLAGAGTVGTQEDRQILSRGIFDPIAVVFIANSDGIQMVAARTRLPQEAREAADHIAGVEDGRGDALWEIATALASGRLAHICQLTQSLIEDESLAALFPPVIVLDGDPESLSTYLLQALPTIHDRLWDSHPAQPSELDLTFIDDFLIDLGTSSGDFYSIDLWLESLSEAGKVAPPALFRPYREGDWYRVRHSVLAVAEAIEDEANRVAPAFVKDQGRIGVEVLPVSVWGSGPHRVRATFTENGAEPRGLGVTGAGTARWVAAAIRMACQSLRTGEQVVTDETGMKVTDLAVARKIIQEARRAPLTQARVRLQPVDAAGVYIVHEPEAHLHPAAVASVRRWLIKLAETAASVFVATHSPILLSGESQIIQRVLVLRRPGGTQLRTLTGDLADELTDISEELGLTQGDLLLMMRLALFVEGPHDKIVLEELFAEELRSAGIRIFPVHGVGNLPRIVTSEIVAALGTRIATLSDRTDIARVGSGHPLEEEERIVGRVQAAAERASIAVLTLGLSQPDICCYLDEEVCRKEAPEFLGWNTAYTAFQHAGARKFKDWVRNQYGLRLSENDVRDLARKCARLALRPEELTQKVHELTVYAVNTTTSAKQDH